MWKILVVDDNRNNCELLASTLDGLAQCDIAENGEQALKAYRCSLEQSSFYNAILLDIAMPGIDGMDVLKSIRSQEEEKGIRPEEGIAIFMVTAYKEPFMDAFNIGCDDYILKPIDPDKVIEKIKEKLEK